MITAIMGMAMVMTIIMARTSMAAFMGRTFSYLGIMITAISTTIMDSEATRVEVPGAGFMGVVDTQQVEEAAFTEEAVVVVMEGAADMGDNGHPAGIL